MKSRLIALVVALAFTGTAFSGCLGDFSLGAIGEGTGEGGAARITRMLANPPGADVEPTGNVKEFTLYLHPMENHEMYPGSSMPMWGFSLSDDPATAQFPGPEIRVTEGDLVRIEFRPMVANFEHTIHWHGLHVPWEQDGVPYVSQEPTPAGQSATYEFIAKPAGTYWYHCHVDVEHHLDMGMLGPFIVEPQDPDEDPHFDREATLILDEMDKYHLESGNAPTNNTPQSGDPFDWMEWAERQAQDSYNRNPQVQQATGETGARPQRDWYPVTYAPYNVNLNTYLINGHAFPYTQPVMTKEGDTLRMRLINAGAEVHALHLHGHHMLVTHKDGILLESPYWADTVLIAPGERYDVYVAGNNPGVWMMHDHIEGNTANDNIWPGGMMTMLVYERFMDDFGGGGGHEGHAGLSLTQQSGAWLRTYHRITP